MKEININNFEEKLYYEKLDNGFEVYLVPLKNKNNYNISLGVKYGNCYTDFMVDGKIYKTPSGVAHFLEHKLFERKNNVSPFDYYSKSGTSVNACTSILYTNYYCVGNNAFSENLDYLLKWVTNIYITDENVAKEKGIILEEERMYEDNPDRVLNERSRANLFVNDPYGKKVVGEEEDIKNITKDDLITCYNSFYTLNNMFLIITGNFDKNDAINIVKNNFSKIKKSKSKIEKIKFEEPDQVKKEYEEIKLNVSTPRISLNYKINKKIFSLDDYNLGIYLSMILRLAFSDTSLFYEEGLEKKLFIDFSYFITITQTHIVITFNIISENDKALEKIEQELKNIKLNEKDFERMRACLIANEVKTVDNVSLMSYDIFDDVIYYGGYKNEKIKDLKNLTYKKMLDVKNKIDISNKAVVKIINNQ